MGANALHPLAAPAAGDDFPQRILQVPAIRVDLDATLAPDGPAPLLRRRLGDEVLTDPDAGREPASAAPLDQIADAVVRFERDAQGVRLPGWIRSFPLPRSWRQAENPAGKASSTSRPRSGRPACGTRLTMSCNLSRCGGARLCGNTTSLRMIRPREAAKAGMPAWTNQAEREAWNERRSRRGFPRHPATSRACPPAKRFEGHAEGGMPPAGRPARRPAPSGPCGNEGPGNGRRAFPPAAGRGGGSRRFPTPRRATESVSGSIGADRELRSRAQGRAHEDRHGAAGRAGRDRGRGCR